MAARCARERQRCDDSNNDGSHGWRFSLTVRAAERAEAHHLPVLERGRQGDERGSIRRGGVRRYPLEFDVVSVDAEALAPYREFLAVVRVVRVERFEEQRWFVEEFCEYATGRFVRGVELGVG